MAKTRSFSARIATLVIGSALVIAALVAAHYLWQPFDGIIAFVNQDLGATDATLKHELVAGISLGALAVFVILMLIPILTPGVNTRGFLTAFFRGIIASAVYLATDYFYAAMERQGRFFLLASMAGAIIVTFILVEIIVLTNRQSEHKALRTDITASIASGMAFSLITKLATFAFGYLTPLLPW